MKRFRRWERLLLADSTSLDRSVISDHIDPRVTSNSTTLVGGSASLSEGAVWSYTYFDTSGSASDES
jgi:hypothetical protein